MCRACYCVFQFHFFEKQGFSYIWALCKTNYEPRSPLKRRLQLCTHLSLGSHCVSLSSGHWHPCQLQPSLNICQITSLALSASSLLSNDHPGAQLPQPPLTSGAIGDERKLGPKMTYRYYILYIYNVYNYIFWERCSYACNNFERRCSYVCNNSYLVGLSGGQKTRSIMQRP